MGSLKSMPWGSTKLAPTSPSENIWGDRLDSSMAQFSEQLEALIQFYLQHPHLEPSRLIDLSFEKIFAKGDDAEFPRWCGSGGPMICYDVNGNPLPCHRSSPSQLAEHMLALWFSRPRHQTRLEEAEPSPCVACPFVSGCPSCMALNWLENGDIDRRTNWHCGFILLQMKASAKFKIAKLSREIVSAPQTEEGRVKVSELQYQLDHALFVHELLSSPA